jgi:aryl-alcohol dehydrogenase-like predicted oxidoreductase
VQSTWNVLETSATAALNGAADGGLGIIIKEALANGRLVKDAGVPPVVLELARKYNVGPDAICLAAAVALSCRPVVLCGPISVGQLMDNMKASSIELSEDELAELSSLKEDAAGYWSTRSNLPWT